MLLWELVTREVPFADLSNMEIGMKVSTELPILVLFSVCTDKPIEGSKVFTK